MLCPGLTYASVKKYMNSCDSYACLQTADTEQVLYTSTQVYVQHNT